MKKTGSAKAVEGDSKDVANKLLISLRATKPIEEEEISLLDKFIVKFSKSYEFS